MANNDPMKQHPSRHKRRESPSSAALLGQRIRHARKKAGLTLAELAQGVDRATSLMSQIENGKREPKLSLLEDIASVLGVSVEYLVKREAPSERSALELELEHYQSQNTYKASGLPQVVVGAQMSIDTLRALVGLHRQLRSREQVKAATPEKARMENRRLRQEMVARNNYMEDIEALAGQISAAVGYESKPIDDHGIRAIALYLGYTLHQVNDLPSAARAVRDVKNKRIYMRPPAARASDPRMIVLRNLAGVALRHGVPRDFGDFLRKRVEANYLATALLMPEKSSVPMLRQAKEARELSVLDFANAYQVAYETAAHRFTNLATRHLDIRLHFDRVSAEGIIYKAYANDGIRFPTDVTGAVEGQLICRKYASRRVFRVKVPKTGMHFQYTDTPSGTFFCSAKLIETSQGRYAIGIGVPFEESRWFSGRSTRNRLSSTCPDPTCCRLPNATLAERWEGQAFPEVRAHSHLLAAMPPGAFPGVDTPEIYEFLDRHAMG